MMYFDKGCTFQLVPARLVSIFAIRVPIAVSFACACSTGTPGCNRAITRKTWLSRR